MELHEAEVSYTVLQKSSARNCARIVYMNLQLGTCHLCYLGGIISLSPHYITLYGLVIILTDMLESMLHG
jgi:hypothetical protein